MEYRVKIKELETHIEVMKRTILKLKAEKEVLLEELKELGGSKNGK